MKIHENTSSSPGQCPCNSGRSFLHCCKPILDDHSLASTPEMLMRSRYTSYFLKNSDHLLRTWHHTCRPEAIIFDKRKWIKLSIYESSQAPGSTGYATVSYSAVFLSSSTVVTMREISRFVKENDRWYYRDGDVDIEREELSGKAKCPCGSGNKFKRCCKE